MSKYSGQGVEQTSDGGGAGGGDLFDETGADVTMPGGGGGPPGAHAPTHEDGGTDEIDVGGLSGLLADPQTPLSHATSHQNGGADEINVAGLSGELADAQPVTIRKNTGADVGTRSRLNLIEGAGISLTVADDGGSDEVDITVTATGGATGQGSVGPRGRSVQGPRGRSMLGPKGDPGAAGAAGDAGPQGRSGMPGHDGDRGRRGFPGLPGQPGAPGADGAAGQQGNPGLALRGRRGADGARGRPIPGGRGLDGAAGTIGVNGANGPRGRRGQDGASGRRARTVSPIATKTNHGTVILANDLEYTPNEVIRADDIRITTSLFKKRHMQMLARFGPIGSPAVIDSVGMKIAAMSGNGVSNIIPGTTYCVIRFLANAGTNSYRQYLDLPAGVAGGGLLRTGFDAVCGFLIQTGVTHTFIRMWLGLTDADLHTISSPTAASVCAFRYDTSVDVATTNWRAVSSNGAGGVQVTDTGVNAAATATGFRFIILTSTTTITFMIADVVVAVHSTFVPGNIDLGHTVSCTTLDAANKRIEWGRSFYQHSEFSL